MENPQNSREAAGRLERWQSKLLPWMIIIPTLSIVLFIYFSTRQLDDFKASINGYREESVIDYLPPLSDSSHQYTGLQNNLEYIKWYSKVKMEERALDHRYAQTGFLLIARTYSKYLGFFTGMILAIVASVFIISKLREDTSQLEGTVNEKIRFKLISSSPGVIFALLGTALMMATILYNPEIGQTDAPLYITPEIILQGNNPAPNGNSVEKGKIPVSEIMNLAADTVRKK